MDHERRTGAETRSSLLQGDEFFHKILSRNSSVGCSSRVYYCRSAEGVPFHWEMQPGTPKHPQDDDIIPPLRRPPAVSGLDLPKTCFEQPKAQTWRKLRFWKKRKTNKPSKNVNARFRESHDCPDKFEKFESCSSDSEVMASTRISSSSSLSSLSFPNLPSFQSSRLQSEGRDSFHGPFSCSPWNMTSILISIARRSRC